MLNLEKTEKEVARRILDFLSGVAYANNGKVKRIATGTYIITPYTVDLTGEGVLDELENNGRKTAGLFENFFGKTLLFGVSGRKPGGVLPGLAARGANRPSVLGRL